MNLSPVILFTYNRLNHTTQTVDALKKNSLASETTLYIYSDSGKNNEEKNKVADVRKYIKNITGFRKVVVIEQKKNIGLANSIINGVSDIVSKYGKVIVLEDDLVTSPYFLDYMNKALILYENNTTVASIHGYTYPTKIELPETFFLKGADCWGWGTWKRAWDIFEEDGKKLLSELQQKKLCKEFDYDNAYPYTKMLRDQINKKNDSWAIRWYASTFLRNKLTLYPGKSLINNIGNDLSGTHCTYSDKFTHKLDGNRISVEQIQTYESALARSAFKRFFRELKLFKVNIKPSLDVKKILKNITPPIVINLYLKSLNNNHFKEKYNTWGEALNNSRGYDSAVILEKVKASSLKVKNGKAAFERDSVTFDKMDYSYPVLTSLLYIAALNKGALNILDFGGSLGSSYFQNIPFLSDLHCLQWSIVEQPHFVDCGKKTFTTRNLKFYETINDCLKYQHPDALLLSSVLQYLEKPYDLLEEIKNKKFKYIIIDMTPFHKEETDFITVQKVPDEIYPADYPCWVFSLEKFLQFLNDDYQLITDFKSLDFPALEKFSANYMGFFFKLRKK